MVNTKRLILHLGSNMGDRLAYLTQGFKGLELEFGKPIGMSQLYETKAWGNTGQAQFLNRAAIYECNQMPQTILRKLKDLELETGRKQRGTWEERELDIDIIFYESDIINTPNLKIPHGLLHERKFVLVPLNEICPDFIHPILNKRVAEILQHCTDELTVNVWTPN